MVSIGKISFICVYIEKKPLQYSFKEWPSQSISNFNTGT
jgi:hypothetical protein